MFRILMSSLAVWALLLTYREAWTWWRLAIYIAVHLAGFFLAIRDAVREGGIGLPADFDHQRMILGDLSSARLVDVTTSGDSVSAAVEWDQAKYGATGTVNVVKGAATVSGRQVTAPSLRALDACIFAVTFVDGSVMKVAKRILSVPSIINFRDIGGYEGVGGKRVAWRKVFRSGQWSSATEEDVEFLITELNISAAVDLRNDKEKRLDDSLEVMLARNGRAEDLMLHSVQVDGHITLWGAMSIVASMFFSRNKLPDNLREYYVELADERASEWAKFLSIFADESQLPLAFHCKSGKDRTGIGAALLLSVLGVDEDVIVAEYSQSNREYPRAYADYKLKSLAKFGVPDEDMRHVLVANPEWLRNLLRHLTSTYGSVEKYLTGKGGLSQEDLDAIRRNLLVA